MDTTNTTVTNTATNVPAGSYGAWLKARSTEAEFMEFLGATTPDEAIAKALERSNDSAGQEKLKLEFTAFFRVKMNLPATVGRV